MEIEKTWPQKFQKLQNDTSMLYLVWDTAGNLEILVILTLMAILLVLIFCSPPRNGPALQQLKCNCHVCMNAVFVSFHTSIIQHHPTIYTPNINPPMCLVMIEFGWLYHSPLSVPKDIHTFEAKQQHFSLISATIRWLDG